ncbi:uncharacterized protein LOC143461907 [Clavelina lepadiformis]|uniref:uncharacterized protein LOC143461907 n=1 Tax=Clavelina lepadiformis TaxID=159417 RepID=UPI004042D4E5
MESKKCHSSELLDENLEPASSSWKQKLLLTSETGSKDDNECDVALPTTKPHFFQCKDSALMDRVKSFLPKIQAANEEINVDNLQDTDKYDIENVDGCSKVIEMNISVVDDLEKTGIVRFLDQMSSDSSDSETDSESDQKIDLNIAKNNQS